MKKNIKLYKFNEIDSTNEYLRKNHKSYEEFDVISARTQTHGKARRQNDWVSMDGMALFSFFLKERDNWEIEDYLKLPLIAGIAVIKGLRKIENLEYKFKWTNDVYVENMKLCGILIEKTEDVYITGIGINVNNMLPENLKSKAISLTQIRNKKYEIDEVIKNIVLEFQTLCENLENGFWKDILKEINQINYLKGKKIELKFGNEVISGVAHNINKDGEIEVLMEQNEAGEREVRSFSVGEVFEKIVYSS
ncbi:biotin--[acetyl-CoA-carboxylase] ligase [Leptotrichia massiliensis]